MLIILWKIEGKNDGHPSEIFNEPKKYLLNLLCYLLPSNTYLHPTRNSTFFVPYIIPPLWSLPTIGMRQNKTRRLSRKACPQVLQSTSYSPQLLHSTFYIPHILFSKS